MSAGYFANKHCFTDKLNCHTSYHSFTVFESHSPHPKLPSFSAQDLNNFKDRDKGISFSYGLTEQMCRVVLPSTPSNPFKTVTPIRNWPPVTESAGTVSIADEQILVTPCM